MANPVVLNVSGIFIDGNNFTGKYTIAVSQSADIILQSVITEWERKYIMQMLGVELGKLLIAYKEAQPNSDPPVSRYDDLIAPFDIQDSNAFNSFPFNRPNPVHSSLGIADALAGLIYYHYINNDQVKNSQSGMVIPDVETAKVLSPLGASKVAESRWNAALETIRAIQWFCQWKSDTATGAFIYPEYQGEYFPPQYTSII